MSGDLPSPGRFPTVEEETSVELEEGPFGTRRHSSESANSANEERHGRDVSTSSGTAFDPRSAASGSDSRTPSPTSRVREGSDTSVQSFARRDSLAPSIAARQRMSSIGSTLSPHSTRHGSGGNANASRAMASSGSRDTPAGQSVSTDERLLNFHKVVSTDSDTASVSALKSKAKLRDQRDALLSQQFTLEALRVWGKEQEEREELAGGDLWPILKASVKRFYKNENHSLPSDDKLISLAHHYYPPVGKIPIEVCDFGSGRAEHFTTNLGEVEKLWDQKPLWAAVRWIHAPLGIGIMHSSVEDLFLHAGPEKGFAFTETGGSSFPFLQTEIMEVQSRKGFQEKRDVCVLLKRVRGLADQLNMTTWEGDQNEKLAGDVQWRVKHLGTRATYWNLEQSDMARQLSEGLSIGMEGPHSGLKPVDRHLEVQMLARHPFYRSSQLVKNPFRCFHRADGCLLTLAPGAGINYLDKDLSSYLQDPPESLFDNEKASAVGNVWKMFSMTGTDSWHRPTVEWFMIFLLTEMLATPHGMCQGYNAPGIMNAYQLIVQDLKRRRFEPRKRNEAVQLVEDYIACVDEISAIVHLQEAKLKMLANMRKDCKHLEREEAFRAFRPGTEKSAVARVDWVAAIATEQHQSMSSLLKDLNGAMQALFQLRSIEQNELAIQAESQGKAILLFTGVTIIFLPLSFFTSYFGMNLRGISNTSRTESYFWAVCGTIAIFLVFFTLLFAFRRHVKNLFRVRRVESLGGFEV